MLSRTACFRGLAGVVVLCLSSALPAGNPAYLIHTIAGSNNSGDNGPATAAFVSILEGICADNAGNIYIADADDHRVRRIDAKGIITTVVGIGAAGFGGDHGPAREALLSSPYGVRLDSSGNLYIADLGNGRIRRVTTDGIITTVAAGLNQPRNMAFDGSGNLLVSEFGAHRIRRIQSDGSAATVAGTGQPGRGGDGAAALQAQFNSPAGIVMDAAGTLYVADSGNGRIRQIKADGTVSTFVAGLTLPTGVAVDASGKICVAQAAIPYVFCADADGRTMPRPGIGHDLFAGAGKLYIAGAQHVEVLGTDGLLTEVTGQATHTFGDGGSALAARFETVSSVAVDTTGAVVVVDRKFRRLRSISPNGTINSLQASDYVIDPRSAAFDTTGRLFVADAGRIGLADPTGPAQTVLDKVSEPAALAFDAQSELFFVATGHAYRLVPGVLGEPAIAALVGPDLADPLGIAVSPAGEVYVAETGHHRILRILADGTATAIAGTGTSGYSGDDGPATIASLNAPTGLAFDPTGNLWVADTGNQRVRYIDPSGNIHTAAGNGTQGFSGDGSSATGAQLSNPTSVACDAHGNIYVGDAGNRRVRLLTIGSPPGPNTNGVITITNAATFKPGPVVGGEIVSLFGANIGPATALSGTLDRNGNLGSQLDGLQVLFDGVAAPLYYAGANQINAQVPVETGGHLSVPITVLRNGVTTATSNVDVVPYDPGLFAVNGFVAALNQDGSLNGPTHPASAGAVLVLFGTGLGGTAPAEKTGVPASSPLGIPLAGVSVLINSEAAQVLYAGDAPGFVGLSQINVRIPADITQSGPVEVRIASGSVFSPSAIYFYLQ